MATNKPQTTPLDNPQPPTLPIRALAFIYLLKSCRMPNVIQSWKLSATWQSPASVEHKLIIVRCCKPEPHILTPGIKTYSSRILTSRILTIPKQYWAAKAFFLIVFNWLIALNSQSFNDHVLSAGIKESHYYTCLIKPSLYFPHCKLCANSSFGFL